MKRKRYQSKKKFLEARQKFRLKCIVFALLCVALIVGIVYLLRLEQLQITTVTVSEVQYADKNSIADAVAAMLDKKYFFFIPKSNTALFPKRAIAQYLLETHVSFEEVKIQRMGLTGIEIIITEFSPVGTFCESTLQTDILDEDSIIIEPYASGTRVLPGNNSAFARTALRAEILNQPQHCFLFNDESLLYATTSLQPETRSFHGLLPEYKVGAFGYAIADMQTALQFGEELTKLQLNAESIWTKKGEVYTIQTSEGMKIHIDPKDDPLQLFRNMKTLLENNVITEGYYKTIDYVDLRFGNRVFYREVE